VINKLFNKTMQKLSAKLKMGPETTAPPNIHFAMIGLDNRNLWVVGRLISLTYQQCRIYL